MKIRLTHTNINTLKHGIYWDTITTGLVLHVGKKRRSFGLNAHVDGKKYDERIGRWPEMSLADAREVVRERIRRIERGHTAPPPAVIARANGEMTLGGLIEEYERYRRAKGERIKSLGEQMRMLRKNLDPWLTKPAAEITKSDVREARDLIAARGALGASNKLLAYMQPMFKWASQEDHIPFNFIPDIVRLGSPQVRARFLDDGEIALLWKATHGANTPSLLAYCRMLRFLLVTGQRRGEAAGMDWRDVEDETWHQRENKASRPQDVPLSPLALSCMNGRSDAGLVFAGISGRMSGWSKLKVKVDRRCRIREPWTPHDLRRTFASGLQRLGVDREVIAACLNHSIPGVTSTYMRDKLEPQKHEAMNVWSDHVAGIVGSARHE